MKRFLFLLFFLATAALPGWAEAADASSIAYDYDGDGYDDATEMANGYSPWGRGRLQDSDADVDGLSDADEFIFGTHPLNPDTDGDGYGDGAEVQYGYDPANPQPEKLKKHIEIIISRQELTYYLGPKKVATHLVSTGRRGMSTPTGTFAIRDKIPRAWSRSSRLWMPYWMPFIGTSYGIHELPEWPGGYKEGANHLGVPVSHGCVRLGVGPAKSLYEWVDVGTPVIIRS